MRLTHDGDFKRALAIAVVIDGDADVDAGVRLGSVHHLDAVRVAVVRDCAAIILIQLLLSAVPKHI